MTQGAPGRSSSPTIVETFFGLDSSTQTLPGATWGGGYEFLPVESGPESSSWVLAAAATMSIAFGLCT